MMIISLSISYEVLFCFELEVKVIVPDQTGNDLIRELTKVMNDISLDIREIKTTLTHFGEKFDSVQQDIREVRKVAKDNEHETDALKIKVNTVEFQSNEIKSDVEILFRKLKERDMKSDADRKWLVGTILTVVGLVFVVIINFIK